MKSCIRQLCHKMLATPGLVVMSVRGVTRNDRLDGGQEAQVG